MMSVDGVWINLIFNVLSYLYVKNILLDIVIKLFGIIYFVFIVDDI